MDDRFEEIRKLLDSTISEFQSLFQSASGFEETRVGNGWTPEKINPEINFVEPKPIDEITRIAETRKRSLFGRRVLSFLKPRDNEIASPVAPKIRLIPFWRIKGFYECFYFRGNSYRLALPDDVIAVEVEGKVRDLVGGGEAGDSQKLTNFTRRLLGKREAVSKSIRLSDVTELAYMFKDGVSFVNAEGKEDLEAEAFFEGHLPLQKVTLQELNRIFPGVEISKGAVSKDDLVRRLHSSLVKPPTAFTRILSNRFQITELAEFLMPTYLFEYRFKGLTRKLTIHGFTGAIIS